MGGTLQSRYLFPAVVIDVDGNFHLIADYHPERIKPELGSLDCRSRRIGHGHSCTVLGFSLEVDDFESNRLTYPMQSQFADQMPLAVGTGYQPDLGKVDGGKSLDIEEGGTSEQAIPAGRP
jgi:hypothetical protein